MRTIIITGSGTATTTVAAATALGTAAAGRKTLLASFGPTHRLSALLDQSLASTPQQLAEQLDGCVFESLDALATVWEHNRAKLSGAIAQLSGDELPPLPGIDLFFGLQQLREQARNYDVAVIDAGDYGALLRAVAIPDGFRWMLRLLFGLDRGPGRSAQSQARALVPTALLPFEWLGQVQDARVAAEELRNAATYNSGASLGFVLPPDYAAMEDARLAIPALQLHGLTVAALFIGPMLPADLPNEQLSALAGSQHALAESAQATWVPRPLFCLPLTWPDRGIAALTALAQTLYADTSPETAFEGMPPIELLDKAALSFRLPGLPRGALRLTLSGDELIVRVGPYRRHVLLPEQLRGITSIKATRDGDRVIVERRM